MAFSPDLKDDGREPEKNTVPTERSSLDDSVPSPYDEDAAAALKAAHRKVDVRLLLWYSFVYLIMRVHVNNITNTAIINLEQGHGIKKQLGNLSSQQWAWVLSIFYYPYAVFEPLSTMLLKKFSPSVWMARIMITWGIISMCQGATKSYSGILACRFFLGFAEAGFYPGVLYHLSFWYPTDRMPWRVAFFYASGQFSGTISGLLAYAISFMDGTAGLAAWRWVFILEGIPAILCGFYTFFFLPNYPETSKFLTPKETHIIKDALPKTQPTMNGKAFNAAEVKALLTEPTTLTFCLLWICHGIGGWGVTFVLPTAIYQLGLTDTAISQLMTMPPYTVAFVILVGSGFLVHKGKLNSWVMAIACECVSIICYILLMTVKAPVAKYIFVTIALSFSICVYPLIWPERIRAARGTSTAGLAIGLTNAAAQFQGIIGPQVYQTKFGPTYRVSFGTSIGLLVACIGFISTSWYLVRRGDRKRAALVDGDSI